MNSIVIHKILDKDRTLSRHLKGVFAANDLINLNISNGLYIVNTDERGEPGSRWCVFYFDNQVSEFLTRWVILQSFVTPISKIIWLYRINPTSTFAHNFKVSAPIFAQCTVYIIATCAVEDMYCAIL